MNGIGERAGNVALEEVAIALDQGYDIDTLDTAELYSLAQTVADATGVPLPPNKSVAGENAFAHEIGIHTDGTLKDHHMYEPYPPELVGRTRQLVLGKHAGRAGVKAVCDQYDLDIPDSALDELVTRVKRLGEQGPVTDADLLAIVEEWRDQEDKARTS